MNLTKIEKKILQQLTTNGAATIQELTEALACSLSGAQKAMRTLRAADLIRPHDLKHVPGFYKRHRTYVTNRSHTFGDQNPLLVRVIELEERFKNLIETHNRMVLKFSEYAKNVSNFGGKVEQLDRWFRDQEAWLEDHDRRIHALEPVATVDPIYADIERELTDKLTTFSPELLRATIDSAYAERTKQQGEVQ
jgi:predicted transcriptional regulator